MKYVGFGKRFLAYWVDFLIMFPTGLMLQLMLGHSPFEIFRYNTFEQLQKAQLTSLVFLYSLVGFVFVIAFYVIFWVSFDGATPGKKLLGIKIVREDGSKLGYPHAFIRYVGYLLSSVVFSLGFLWVMGDSKKQGWHDKIAGTVVIETDRKPRKFLAILLTVVSLTMFLGYMGAVYMKVFSLVLKDAGNINANRRPAQSLKENKEGMSLEAKAHYDKSLELFSQMSEYSSNFQDAQKPLADEIVKEAKLAVEASPDNPLLWSNLGNAYTWPNNIGTTESALEAYRKAENLDQNNVVYLNSVGDELIRLGRNEEAVLQFQKSLRLTGNSGYAHVSMGRAYLGLKIYDEARTHLEKGIEIFKSNNDGGKYDKQILDAQKMLANIPK